MHLFICVCLFNSIACVLSMFLHLSSMVLTDLEPTMKEHSFIRQKASVATHKTQARCGGISDSVTALRTVFVASPADNQPTADFGLGPQSICRGCPQTIVDQPNGCRAANISSKVTREIYIGTAALPCTSS